MKVLNLRCAQDHGFEGWFASEADFLDQVARGVVECPLCGSPQVSRLPSAPRLNAAAVPEAAKLQSMWMQAVANVLKNTEDVGARFPEEARRIHYGESANRGIRGQASAEDRAALADEGIEVMPLPMPAAMKGPAH